jgi:hypothetical protein
MVFASDSFVRLASPQNSPAKKILRLQKTKKRRFLEQIPGVCKQVRGEKNHGKDCGCSRNDGRCVLKMAVMIFAVLIRTSVCSSFRNIKAVEYWFVAGAAVSACGTV